MKNKLSILERMTLEILSEKALSLREIVLQSELSLNIQLNVLNSLIEKKLIKVKDNHYSICNLNVKFEGIDDELIEILHPIIKDAIKNKQEKSKFSLKKVWMNEQEKSIYKSLLFNLEQFLSSLKNTSDKKSSQEIIFWGNGQYKQVIESLLN